MGNVYRAVAVDLGATSVRFAEGELRDGKIAFRVIEQSPNQPVETPSGPVWSVDTLLGICQRAEQRAKRIGGTLGIDSWGVDHGFVDVKGKLLQAPACYRDPAHVRAFDEMASSRNRLYALTGVQHQPFNTIYQLVARKSQNPELQKGATRWLNLPELMAHLLGCPAGHELTQASTTSLLGLDGKWSKEAFEIAGWPVPSQQPEPPGKVVGETSRDVELVRVGGHDTASAVCGLGALKSDQAFLSVGTWSLLGILLNKPLATPEAEAANFTNERAVDGRVRFLANIPGFFVINGLHDELKIKKSVPEWLASANTAVSERIDLFAPDLFSPESMLEAVQSQLEKGGALSQIKKGDARSQRAFRDPDWAGLALMSLVEATATQVKRLEEVSGIRIMELRVVGGGSASEAFCQKLANAAKKPVLAGPQEATLLGNLGVQFLAKGAITSFEELGNAISASIEIQRHEPA